MGKPRRMSGTQARSVRTLVRRLCANFDSGNCLLLDDGNTCACPQISSRSLLCQYFRTAVLPSDQELYIAILGKPGAKSCAECGQLFIPANKKTVYCPDCAKKRARRSKREWAAKNRERRRKNKA